MEATEDAAKKQQLVNDQGKAYDAALAYMREDDASAQTEVEDYIVTLACEEAEGMYMPTRDGELTWQRPDKEHNLHVEIAVQDKRDKRFIPGLEVRVQLLDQSGNEIGDEADLPFLWHPFLYHYGKNFSVPDDGSYAARVSIGAPQFGRHDSEVGNRYPQPVTVDIGPVDVSTGQKPVGPE